MKTILFKNKIIKCITNRIHEKNTINTIIDNELFKVDDHGINKKIFEYST